MQFQTWICPKCYDDHLIDGPCSPLGVDKFSPSPDDNSYIAEEFRKLELRLSRAEALLERAKECIENYMHSDRDHEWLKDFEELRKG